MAAKQKLIEAMMSSSLSPGLLPLEPSDLTFGCHEFIYELSDLICFTAHKQEARNLFDCLDIPTFDQFDQVTWQVVHYTIHKLPKMLQLFAVKQVFNVAAMVSNLSRQKDYAFGGESVTAVC